MEVSGEFYAPQYRLKKCLGGSWGRRGSFGDEKYAPAEK